VGYGVVGGVLSPALSKAEGLSKGGLVGEVRLGSGPEDGRCAQTVPHGRAPDRLDGHLGLVPAANISGEIVLGAMVFVSDDAGFVREAATTYGSMGRGAQRRVNALGVLGFYPFLHQLGQVGHEAVGQVLFDEIGSRPA
jgi:hypothetical protein